MHGRLKQRLLSYSFLLFILVLIVKLFHLNKECKGENSQTHNHHVKRDAWNLNEHQIEANMVKEIERLKRSNRGKKILGNVFEDFRFLILFLFLEKKLKLKS